MALVSNFSGFCLSANALHLTGNLDGVFAGKTLFLLSLEVLVDCLLVSGTSGGKSTFIYIVCLCLQCVVFLLQKLLRLHFFLHVCTLAVFL